MALDAAIVALIRDEIGNDTDFSDNTPHSSPQLDSLENIYTDSARGESSPLITALIVWRRRLHSLQARSFDLTTEGSLLSRNQRIRFMERKIHKLENILDFTAKGRNSYPINPSTLDLVEGAEFS